MKHEDNILLAVCLIIGYVLLMLSLTLIAYVKTRKDVKVFDKRFSDNHFYDERVLFES